MIGFHHMRVRALVAKGLEPFPSRSTWKRLLDYVMYVVAFVAPFALVPQILQLYTTKDAEGLSLPSWALFVFFNVLWTIYGAAHKDAHIFFANVIMMLFNLIVVVGILIY